MRDFGRRPLGRLCCWVMMVSVFGVGMAAFAGARPTAPQTLNTTTVADTVYLADGAPASGTLIITWPAFLTSGGAAVGAGSTNVTLGTNGALSVSLVPNAGASPAGVYYSVTYQLGAGEVRTEYWIVPASTGAVNLAAVRTTPGSGVAAQPVSIEYVNSQLATVVHLNGAETITGTKTFSTAPNVPNPQNPGDVANKAYVDSSVTNVGSGSYLSTAGGTMTGPITLPGNPAAPLQASTKEYVDTGLAAKADLISGLVPANELGTGLPSAGSCLLGNGSSGTWGACGGGSGSGNVSTTPAASQTIAQPEGTQFSTNNLANIRYVTASWNWSQNPSDNLGTAGSNTIHLTPCPLGIDSNSAAEFYSYKVYISGTGTVEAAPVTGGTCTSGASSGTIIVTTANAHSAGYTVGSASSGIQEAWNDAWVNDTENGGNPGSAVAPYVKLTADTLYPVYATVYLRGRGGVLDGTGALIQSNTRDRTIYIGTTQSTPYVNHHKLYNLSGTSMINVDGVQVASVSAASGTYTVTTAATHPFVVGDWVACEYYTPYISQHAVQQVTAVPSSTQFQFVLGSSTVTSASGFGYCGLENAFIENNSDHVAIQDVNIFQMVVNGTGQFSYGIVNDNDQQFIIERAANRSSGVIRYDANWPLGAFFYQRTDGVNAGIMYIHDTELTGANCYTGGGNGFVITDSVCQGFPTYGIRYFGGLQPMTISNVYEESTGGSSNVLYPSGVSAQMGVLAQGKTTIHGQFPVSGYLPTFANQSGQNTTKQYYVSPINQSGQHGPLYYIGQALTVGTTGGGNVTLTWPSITLQNSIGGAITSLTWDIAYTTGNPAGAPIAGNLTAVGTSVSATCGTNGMCSYVDPQTSTTAYTPVAQGFYPEFWFMPADLVVQNSATFMDEFNGLSHVLSNIGTLGVSLYAQQCTSGNNNYRSPIWIECPGSDNSGGSGSMAEVLQEQDQANNGPAAGSKGRLNFGKPIGNVPNDLITLQDSNSTKTLSTYGHRPTNDAGDMAIGLDQNNGLAERAPTSISWYNTQPNSGATNFLARLAATGETLNVPLTVNGNFSVPSGTVTLPVTGSGNQCLHVSSTGVVSGTGSDCGSGSGTTVVVNTGVTSQLAEYSANGAVSGDSTLMDTGTTLSYSGTGGISTTAGTFSGNLTVNGQLLVAGPWMVSSPVPGTAMSAASAGTSSLGISNDGYFYISPNGGSPQKVATTATSSYFTNLFQEDANDLGEYNTNAPTTAQNLHVYSQYNSSSSWQRTSLGFDSTDGYAAVKSESLPAGGAAGLGFWINNGLKWVIDPTSNFKPWADALYNIGSFTASTGTGLRPATVYAAGNSSSNSGFELGKYASNSYELCNDATTGTVINGLAVLTGAGCAAKPTSAVTSGVIGVVIANAGTSGTTTLVRTGSAYCSFDTTATTVGDYVVASSVNGSYFACHDAGSTLPSGQQVLGRVLQATGGGVVAQMFFDMPGSGVSAKAMTPPDAPASVWMTVSHASSAGTVFSSSANKAAFFGVMLGYQKTTSQVSYYVYTGDTSATTYDLGIYSGTSGGTCTLMTHTGSIAGSTAMTAGAHTVNWTGGSVTMAPGRYYLALTASATSGTAVLYGDSAGVTFAGGTGASSVGNVAISAGGSLPASVTCPTDSVQVAALIPAWLVD
ncbi:MAG TPA: hypothetical protein VMX38_01490 [Verrucomicrobiae bacterium]|nr:hypothetical protein [Verrucomicrobiae bacterium]